MSFDAATTSRPRLEADRESSVRHPTPEIRVDDEDGAARLTPPVVGEDFVWTGDERRRSMPASHSRFVDEPYVFSLSQALALSGRRRSEPFMDSSTETREISSDSSGGSPVSPHGHVFVDQVASSGKRVPAVAGERRSSVDVVPKTTTTTLTSLDELSNARLAARSSHDSSYVSQDSDEELMTKTATASRFLSLPQTSDYLAVPARRHSVALIHPATSRILDVIAEESVVTDSKSLASSRRYSLSCHLNT